MKRILLAIFVAIVSTACFAQWSPGSFTIQTKVGLSVANVTNDDLAETRLGLVAGAEFEYQISNKFSLEAGLLYSQQGTKVKDSQYKTTEKIDYLNIPILANIYVVPGLAFKFGLQPGINLCAKVKGSSNGVDVTFDMKDFGYEVRSFDVSIPFGLSYEFNNIVIDGRYNLGLTKFIEHGQSKHCIFQFTLGYKFSLF